jgi:hypothetical protein
MASQMQKVSNQARTLFALVLLLASFVPVYSTGACPPTDCSKMSMSAMHCAACCAAKHSSHAKGHRAQKSESRTSCPCTFKSSPSPVRNSVWAVAPFASFIGIVPTGPRVPAGPSVLTTAKTIPFYSDQSPPDSRGDPCQGRAPPVA